MSAITRRNPWTSWVAWTRRQADARPLALARILVCACIVGDLLRVLQLGLVDDYGLLYDDGGLNDHPDKAALVDDWFGASGGLVAFWASLGALSLAGLGLFTRPMLVLGALAYAQFGHLYSPGDRGIDRILRTVLLILIFSGSHKRLALGNLLRPAWRADHVPAWPMALIKWLMVMIYLSAGISKLMDQPEWLGLPQWPVVYRILTDPMAAHVDPVWAAQLWPLWIFCSWMTIVVELSSPLLLTRHAHRWAMLAIPMHLGIAMAMELGMFSWGMLALYTVVLADQLVPRLERVPWLRNRRPRSPTGEHAR